MISSAMVYTTHIVSFRAPFLALVNGERIAIVITTSSGCFCSKAVKPVAGALVRCEESCLRRCRAIASSFEEALLDSRAMSYCDDVKRNQFIRNLIPGKAPVQPARWYIIVSYHSTLRSFSAFPHCGLDQDVHAVWSLPHNNHWL
jgi:hypothetical protein